MKKSIVLLILAIFFVSAVSSVQARDNTSHTTVIGAASGAIIGQAIGRNTEGTLIGATLGSVVGYIVGNEMDKNGYVRHSAPVPVQRRVYMVPQQRPVEVVVIPDHKHRRPGYGPKHWRGNGHRWGHYKNDHFRNRHHKDYRHRTGIYTRVVIW